MATDNKLKYIAEGFLEDSTRLMNDFLKLDTLEFPEFAKLWRQHHFSLIFMGRSDDAEMCEFVNEIFRITTHFLVTSSMHQQVGALFILYGLYRNQISDPPIMIRIEVKHWKIIRKLRDEAVEKKYKTLHYVLDYLIKHGFIFVANETLKGPLIGNVPKTSQNDELICSLKTTYKSDILNYSANNNLTALLDLQKQYMAEKSNCAFARGNIEDIHEFYDEAIKELQEIVNPQKKTKFKEDLGERRAKIKAQSFIRKTKNRFGVASDEERGFPEENDPDYRFTSSGKRKVRYRRPRRTPKEDRRVGRPSTKPKKPEEPKSDDESIDISHLLSQQHHFYLPPKFDNKKVRTKRDPYYQTSPKREEVCSDPDEDGSTNNDNNSCRSTIYPSNDTSSYADTTSISIGSVSISDIGNGTINDVGNSTISDIGNGTISDIEISSSSDGDIGSEIENAIENEIDDTDSDDSV